MKFVVAFVALIAFSLAQTDTPCSVPNQFQSFIQQIVVDYTGNCAASTSEGILYFDYPNQVSLKTAVD